jgi:DNA-binding Lrp family transcriptional regulator
MTEPAHYRVDRFKKPDIERRRLEVVKYMHGRYSYREIAAKMGCSAATVYRDVKGITEEWKKRYAATADEHLARYLASLDADECALRELMEGTLTVEDRLAVFDRVLKLMDRRAKALGLEVPETRHQLLVQNNTSVNVQTGQAPIYTVGGPDQSEEEYLATLEKGKAWLPSAQRTVKAIEAKDVTVRETNGTNGAT